MLVVRTIKPTERKRGERRERGGGSRASFKWANSLIPMNRTTRVPWATRRERSEKHTTDLQLYTRHVPQLPLTSAPHAQILQKQKTEHSAHIFPPIIIFTSNTSRLFLYIRDGKLSKIGKRGSINNNVFTLKQFIAQYLSRATADSVSQLSCVLPRPINSSSAPCKVDVLPRGKYRRMKRPQRRKTDIWTVCVLKVCSVFCQCCCDCLCAADWKNAACKTPTLKCCCHVCVFKKWRCFSSSAFLSPQGVEGLICVDVSSVRDGVSETPRRIFFFKNPNDLWLLSSFLINSSASRGHLHSQ